MPGHLASCRPGDGDRLAVGLPHQVTPAWLIFSRAAADWSSPLPMSCTSSMKAANQSAVSGASASAAILGAPSGAGSGQTSSAEPVQPLAPRWTSTRPRRFAVPPAVGERLRHLGVGVHPAAAAGGQRHRRQFGGGARPRPR